MTNSPLFANAIQSGLAAARNADSALREIQFVLEALGNALLDASDDRLAVQVDTRFSFLDGLAETSSVLMVPNVNWRTDKKWELGRIAISPTGYPVSVTDNRGCVRDCASQDALRDALAMLLHTPEFGRWYSVLADFVTGYLKQDGPKCLRPRRPT